jgi:hypothetical protein
MTQYDVCHPCADTRILPHNLFNEFFHQIPMIFQRLQKSIFHL